MIKVMFVCHGNICRSTMAEFVFKDMIKKLGKENNFLISSSATSREEIGNDIHYGTKNMLDKLNIPYEKRKAVQITKHDYFNYDYIIAMDRNNIKNLKRIIGDDKDKKVFLLLDFTDNPRDISDPWYTGNFDLTYKDIKEGLLGFLDYLNI